MTSPRDLAASPVRVLFFGTPDFAAHALDALLHDARYQVVAVVTQPDRPAGRGRRLTPSPVKDLAGRHDIPVLQPERLKGNEQAFLDLLSPFGPIDVGVVVAFGQILPKKILGYPAARCINVHASLLPRWRGAAPIHRAILAGDHETGVCLMEMEPGLDTGPVYACSTITIGDDDTFGTLHGRLAQLGAALLCERLAQIVRERPKPSPQPSEGVTYASKIENRESLIDWGLDACTVSRLVRGLSPVPGAFTSLRGKRVKVFFATAAGKEEHIEKAGTVLRAGPEALEIACGTGYVSITELQLEGKRRMTAGEFCRGIDLQIGELLGHEQHGEASR